MALTFFSAAALWSVASALCIGALGAFLLAGGASRPRGALAFGSFAILWAVQIATFNVAGLVADETMARVLYLVGLACLLALPYFLVEFAAAHGRAEERYAWAAARVVAIVLGAGLALLLAVAPGLLFEGVTPAAGLWFPDWGPGFALLVEAPRFAAMGLVAWVLARQVVRSPTPRLASRAGTLLAGLSLYLAFAASNNLAYYALSAANAGLAAVNGTYVVVFAGLTLLLGGTVLRLLQDARAGPDATRSRWLAAAILVPASAGAIEGLLAYELLPGLNTVGLWRLAGVGIIAYGIARWRIYDLPQRAASAAATAGGVVAATAGGAAAYGAGTLASSGNVVPVLAGLLVLGAAIAPSISFARRLFGIERRFDRPGLEQSLYGQRIDAYRAALEASIARGTLDEDQEFLAALRERFGISEPEERVLLHYARSSVIVSRDRQAWDAYERLRLLGEGGAGRTWLARDRSRDRLVVLKETLPSWQQEPAAREAVLREARLAAKVRHPNVVAVEEVVEEKGAPIIVMEYLEGGSLSDLLRARGTLPWDQARAIALDVLRGLEAVHAGGIVHRDIKPSNVLLDGDGLAKVADFGIAVAPGSAGKTLVLDAPAAGTLAYMAPEAREGRADRRADVYGAGALLHEMLYGAPPHVNSPVVVRKDLPQGLPAVLARALAAAPEARHPTARAFADELARV